MTETRRPFCALPSHSQGGGRVDFIKLGSRFGPGVCRHQHPRGQEGPAELREADIEIKADNLFFFISLRQNAKSVSLN